MLDYDKRRTKTKVGSGQTLDEDEPTTRTSKKQTMISNELGQILEQDKYWMRQTSNIEQKLDQDNIEPGESMDHQYHAGQGENVVTGHTKDRENT